MPTSHPLDGLDALEITTSGRSRIEMFFSDPDSKRRILAAHERGVGHTAIAEFLTQACGREISPKSVAGWLKAQKRAIT